MITLSPEVMKPIQMLQPRTTNGGASTDWISMKDIVRIMIVVELTQAVGHATVLTLAQATAVAGTGTKATTNASKIWANEATGTADTLTRQTNAVSYTVTNDIANKQVVFVIEPSDLDVANNFDCIGLTIADSSQATNFVSVTAIAYKKNQGPAPATDITD